MSEDKKHDPQKGTASNPKSEGAEPGDCMLMGDELPIDELTRFSVGPGVVSELKKYDIKTFGDFRKWSESDINTKMLRTKVNVRGLIVNARKLVGTNKLKKSHDELKKTMEDLNAKKEADAKERRAQH